MALQKGAQKLYNWLKSQTAGTVVSFEEVMAAADWSEVSLKTYLRKNKIAPFLQKVDGDRLKILLDGDDISEQFFHETFTQTGPRHVALGTGDRLEGEDDEYELIEPLGNGAVGHVWSAKVLGPAGGLVAAKVMLPRKDLLQDSKLPNVRERFRREARNGREVVHPNIVRYLDVGNTQQNPFLIMELANRSVAVQIRESGAIPEEEAAGVVLSAIDGLLHLHSKGCPHRDVKPANILEFDDVVKLGDLGIVRWSDFDPAFTKGGTITRQSVQLGSWFYMAPEQQESPHNAVEASDTYALGVSWIEMITGQLPSPQAVGARAYSLPTLRGRMTELIQSMCLYRAAERVSLEVAFAEIKSTYGL